MGIGSFAGYSSLDWHPWSLNALNVCIMLDHNLLAFIVSNEKSGVILIGLPLCITWPFPFVTLNILTLLCMFSILIII